MKLGFLSDFLVLLSACAELRTWSLWFRCCFRFLLGFRSNTEHLRRLVLLWGTNLNSTKGFWRLLSPSREGGTPATAPGSNIPSAWGNKSGSFAPLPEPLRNLHLSMGTLDLFDLLDRSDQIREQLRNASLSTFDSVCFGRRYQHVAFAVLAHWLNL